MHTWLLYAAFVIWVAFTTAMAFRLSDAQKDIERLEYRIAGMGKAHAELKANYESYARANKADREVLLGKLNELSHRVDEIEEPVREREKAEAQMLQGLSNILDYNIGVAKKAVSDRGED